ncbi:MAG: hypothetical protein BWX80_02774 [Candidatus Hydrogenedentes bacterium ADurb.Bin101]|nr:MAG: hypothetical protein BWX80_02774 [Candidatus Hydrogenedentes bacterium ADurb.Bin101]
MVFKDMQPMLLGTFIAHARPDDFREAVDVIGLDIRLGLDAFAHFLRPGLGAEYARLEGQFAQVNAHLRGPFEDAQEITRRAAYGGGPEIFHQHDLAVRIAAGNGNDRGAQGFRPVMGAQPAGKQAVTVCVLNDVAPVKPGGGETTDHNVGPYPQVFPGVGDNNRFARSAARSVQPHNFVHGTGKETEGIGIPQVGLYRKR